jgi:RNA polymerase sigma factor (sigma-70 family)
VRRAAWYSPPRVAEDEQSEVDADQFEALFRRYGPRLRLVARARGVPDSDCDDLIQDVFRRALEGYQAGALRDPEKLAAWCHGIFKNRLADYWRTRLRREELLPEGPLSDQIRAPQHDFAETHRVRQALAKLPKRHRLALVLNTTGGLTTQEIAPFLRRSPGRTGAILAEAKHLFRIHYAEGEETDSPRRLKE